MNRKAQNFYSDFMKNDEAAKWFLKTPDRTTKAFIEYADWTATGRKLDYGCVLDQFLTPPLPGDYISIMARPGHKKSTFMTALAKRYAKQIKDSKQADEIIIYATWDEAVENIEGYIIADYGQFNAGDVAWGRVDRDKAIRGSIKRVGELTPLWIWGKSIMDKDHKKPPFTAEWLFNTVQAAKQKYGVSVKALFLDYLQIIPVGSAKDRTVEVTAASQAAKELAKEIGCPVFAGIQAGRDVESKGDKMPGWADAQHASAIEQDSTKQLALMTPIKYLDPATLRAFQEGKAIDPIEIAGKFYKITPELMIVRILKQRGAIGSGTYPIGINQTTLNIYDPETIDKHVTYLGGN